MSDIPTADKAQRRDQRVTPSTGTFYTSLPALDWGPGGALVHPPEQVVQVCVVNDLTCLNVGRYDEDGKTSTVTTEVEVTVSTQALLSALVSQLDPDVAEAAVRLHAVLPPASGSA